MSAERRSAIHNPLPPNDGKAEERRVNQITAGIIFPWLGGYLSAGVGALTAAAHGRGLPTDIMIMGGLGATIPGDIAMATYYRPLGNVHERRTKAMRLNLDLSIVELGRLDFSTDINQGGNALHEASTSLYRVTKKRGEYIGKHKEPFNGEVYEFTRRDSDTVARKLTVAIGSEGPYDRVRVLAEDIDVSKPVSMSNENVDGQDGVYGLDVLCNTRVKFTIPNAKMTFAAGRYANFQSGESFIFSPDTPDADQRNGFVRGMQTCLYDVRTALEKPTIPPPPAQTRAKLMHQSPPPQPVENEQLTLTEVQ